MKKTAFFLLLCLALTGCSNNQNIGIIGGADGPTSIFVGESSGEKLPIRMLKIDDELYYDTGRVSENTPRCGTFDRALKKSVDEFEIPRKDNTSNFEPANSNYFGYQRVLDKYTVEVPIDGNWVIFRKINDPEFDEDDYKYCMYLKGTLPNAANETELIVLANNKDIDFAKVANSMFSSHSSAYIDKYVIFPNEEDLSWGVYLEADDVSPTGLELEICQSGGYPSGKLQTGAWYEIEKFDGEWKPVDTVITNYGWNAIAYLIPENGEYETKINWEWLYGRLPKGNYRIAKEITDFRETGDFDKKIHYAYFEID